MYFTLMIIKWNLILNTMLDFNQKFKNLFHQ